jgi:hypothetical protein
MSTYDLRAAFNKGYAAAFAEASADYDRVCAERDELRDRAERAEQRLERYWSAMDEKNLNEIFALMDRIAAGQTEEAT